MGTIRAWLNLKIQMKTSGIQWQPLHRSTRKVKCYQVIVRWQRPITLIYRYSCQSGYHLDPLEHALRSCGVLGHWQGSDPICRREYVTKWIQTMFFFSPPSLMIGKIALICNWSRFALSFSNQMWLPRSFGTWSRYRTFLLVWRRHSLFVWWRLQIARQQKPPMPAKRILDWKSTLVQRYFYIKIYGVSSQLFFEEIKCEFDESLFANGHLANFPLPDQNMGSVSVYKVATTISLYCDHPDAEMDGESQLTCTSSGSWDYPLPVCHQLPCSKLPK